jgi:membrane protease YdiL (CAAX protease family)
MNDTAAASPKLTNTRLVMGLSILAILVGNSLDAFIPPAGIPVAIFIIWRILKLTGGRWSDLGLGRPSNWLHTIGLGVALGVTFQLVLTYGLSPILERLGAVHDTSQFAAFKGNNQMLAMYMTVAWTTAGFGEELIWRGFILTRFAKIFGGSRGALIAALLITSVMFGFIHFAQGNLGMIATGVAGLMLGIAFLAGRQNLWLTFIAHGTMDTLAFMALYTGIGV